MTPIISTIKMDLAMSPGLYVIHAVQGDTACRKVQFDLYNGGVPYSPAAGTSATIGWRRADGSAGSYNAIALQEGNSRTAYTLSGNSLTIELNWQVCDKAGDVYLNVGLMDASGAILHTWELLCRVATGAVARAGDPALPSESASSAANRAEQAALRAEQAVSDAAPVLADYLQAVEEYYQQVRTVTLGAQGWYATPDELRAKVPVGENGWWATIGTTDTIWTWDSDAGVWHDSSVGVDLSDYYNRGQIDEKFGPVTSISAGTKDLTPGTSPLASGALYIVYE